MKRTQTQVLASIPFANANPELLFHVLCTFTDTQIHEFARMHKIRESNDRIFTAMNIVDNKDRINATLNVLG